jgi:hypothetical protein
VSPKLFRGIVAALLVLIAALAISAWKQGGGGKAGSPGSAAAATARSPAVAELDLATANSALGAAAPGAGVRITRAELLSSDYPSGHVAPGAYAPAPSYARGMTRAWHTYAAMVDRVCALSWNYMRIVQARGGQVAYERHWTEQRAAATMWSTTADEDARILNATAILGQPPRRQALFARWRANVAHRTALFRQASRAARVGNFRRVQRICARINRLKAQADRLGQRFGLRICTSN